MGYLNDICTVFYDIYLYLVNYNECELLINKEFPFL